MRGYLAKTLLCGSFYRVAGYFPFVIPRHSLPEVFHAFSDHYQSGRQLALCLKRKVLFYSHIDASVIGGHASDLAKYYGDVGVSLQISLITLS